MSVQDFLTRLASIKRAPWQGGKAPHKPVLLLAVADWFEENSPTAALVTVDETLVRLFKENWYKLVSKKATVYKFEAATHCLCYTATNN